MTENETIRVLKQTYDRTDSIYKSNELDDMFKTAIQALEEIQQYRAIGTVEELKSMKENGAFTGVELAQLAAMQMRLKEYSAIGTIDEFKDLKEKSVAKIGLSRGQGHESYLVCPTCNSHMKDDQELWNLDEEIIQCKKCKQLVLIDWQ